MSVERRTRARLLGTCATLVLLAPLMATAQQTQAGEPNDHVSPPAASQPMPAMSDAQMERVMDMHDDPLLAMVKIDQLERAHGDNGFATDWEAEAWIGHDFDKLWLRSEGERAGGSTDARIEAFWDHAFASYWDWQLGVRRDVGSGLQPAPAAGGGLRGTGTTAQRNWAAVGVQGLAPYWFEIEATAYLGEAGRTALRLRAQYELLVTQRLILQPEFEANVYARRDPARAIDSGINDAELGLRLRYEVRREIAPYVGVVWKRRLVDNDPTVDHAVSETQLVAGLRVWF